MAKNRKKGTYFACFYTPYRFQQSYFPVEAFGTGREGVFENIKCMIPSDPDAILRTIYGDYMKLPPEQQRQGHLPLKFDISHVKVPGENDEDK